MSRLAPNLFERRYDDLVEIGRSRLPSEAPAWTDQNAHDPGITLIELLAWVGEAQLYSLAHTRRDERQAYAALMGIEPHGPRPARGLIWPDHDDLQSPAAMVTAGSVIDRGSVVGLEKSAIPEFHTEYRQLWIPARIYALETRLADGSRISQLHANQRGGPAFQPFGADEGGDAVLSMSLAATGRAPLLEVGRPRDARLIIGIRAETGPGLAAAPAVVPARTTSPVEVTLVTDGDRTLLPVVEDSSDGMLRTGALVLDISQVGAVAATATLEFRAPAGFERSPRLIRIEPNVVPIIQQNEATTTYDDRENAGLPDQTFDLETRGLEFEPGSDSVRVEVQHDGVSELWSKTDRLDDCGPEDRTFELDPVAARISFGNGVNGAIPPPHSTVLATYSVTDGEAGNIAANRKWVVHGFEGRFGINPDSTFGGEDASGWLEQRREARVGLREHHALVSATDFAEAAKLLPELEVGRAWMVPSSEADLATGTMRLIAMRSRPPSGESGSVPESPRWLESVRQRLAARAPLGSRLAVIAPRYVEFTITATVEAEPRKNPDDVRAHVRHEIARRLTLVSDKPGTPQRPFGLSVSRRDLVAWVLALPDVRQVRALSIQVAGRAADQVDVSSTGLPRIDLDNSRIDVLRNGGGVS